MCLLRLGKKWLNDSLGWVKKKEKIYRVKVCVLKAFLKLILTFLKVFWKEKKRICNQYNNIWMLITRALVAIDKSLTISLPSSGGEGKTYKDPSRGSPLARVLGMARCLFKTRCPLHSKMSPVSPRKAFSPLAAVPLCSHCDSGGASVAHWLEGKQLIGISQRGDRMPTTKGGARHTDCKRLNKGSIRGPKIDSPLPDDRQKRFRSQLPLSPHPPTRASRSSLSRSPNHRCSKVTPEQLFLHKLNRTQRIGSRRAYLQHWAYTLSRITVVTGRPTDPSTWTRRWVFLSRWK